MNFRVLVNYSICSTLNWHKMNKLSENKRRIFSVEEKANIIWRLEAGESNKKLAQEFSVSHSTISTIFKGKEKTQKSFEESKLKRKKK